MAKLRIALACSVLLNMFLIGALVAGLISLRRDGPRLNGRSLRMAGAELPVAERRPFRAALREVRRSMRATVEHAHDSKARAASLLEQPKIDRSALNAALDQARIADFAVRAAVEKRAVEFAATLPVSDRATLARAMKSRTDHKRHAAE